MPFYQYCKATFGAFVVKSADGIEYSSHDFVKGISLHIHCIH
jgi:hypothetical protein